MIGVQSDAAPAAFRSWQARRLVEDKMETFAEGLATRTAFELPQQILWQWLDDFVLVSDDEIRAAQALMIEATRNLVEAAGAAPLAAGLRLRERLTGKRVVMILSGGNASREQLVEALGIGRLAEQAGHCGVAAPTMRHEGHGRCWSLCWSGGAQRARCEGRHAS